MRSLEQPIFKVEALPQVFQDKNTGSLLPLPQFAHKLMGPYREKQSEQAEVTAPGKLLAHKFGVLPQEKQTTVPTLSSRAVWKFGLEEEAGIAITIESFIVLPKVTDFILNRKHGEVHV